jgi:hypothetical protein
MNARWLRRCAALVAAIAALLLPCGAAASPRHSAASPADPWDFNGDGHADLASGSGSGEVVVVNGTAHGFARHGHRFTPTSPGMPATPKPGNSFFGISLASGDFDRDGYADLAVTDPNRFAVFVLYGTPHGLTTRHSQVLTAGQTGDLYSTTVRVGDLNADGWPDLMIQTVVPGDTDWDQDAITVLWGSAAGFSSDRSYQIPSPNPDVGGFGAEMVSRDLDGDGYPDLVVASPGLVSDDSRKVPGGTWWCPGSASGPQACGSLGGLADGVAIGNVVGGRLLDVVTADAGKVTVYRHSVNGMFYLHQTLTVFRGRAARHLRSGDSLAAAPLHRGGRDDIVVGNTWARHSAGAVAVLRGRQHEVSLKKDLVVRGPGRHGTFGASVATVDVTGDGRRDLLVGSPTASGGGAVSLYRDARHGIVKHRITRRRSELVADRSGRDFGGVID